MNRLIENTVWRGLVTAWRLATWPINRSPSLVNATTDGVVRPPSALGITTGSPPSITDTTELVVPRSIPMIFEAIAGILALVSLPRHGGGTGRRPIGGATSVPGIRARMAGSSAPVVTGAEAGIGGYYIRILERRRAADDPTPARPDGVRPGGPDDGMQQPLPVDRGGGSAQHPVH